MTNPIDENTVSIEEQLKIINAKISMLSATIVAISKEFENFKNKSPINLKKRVLLPMTCLFGKSKGKEYILSVGALPNTFYLGNKVFNSLSAAAEAASGVRRSGKTFWHLSDGKSVKEFLEND